MTVRISEVEIARGLTVSQRGVTREGKRIVVQRQSPSGPRGDDVLTSRFEFTIDEFEDFINAVNIITSSGGVDE